MPSLNLDHLTTFKLVASRKSFSGAADALGLSQPAVSLQIRQLEQTLQARLVERTGRGIRLTAAGQTLLPHISHIDQAVSAALLSVAATTQEVSGTVTLGTGATACIHLLPPLLEQLRTEHPLLTVRVRTGNTQEILQAVEDNRVDIGLVTMPAAGRNLHISPVTQDDFKVIMKKDDNATDRSMTVAELQTLPLIVSEYGSGTRALIDGWFQAEGIAVQPVMELGNIEAIKKMVQAGLGYSIVPGMSVASPQDRIGLSVMALQPVLTRPQGIVMRQDKTLTKSMAELLKLIGG